MDPVLEPVGRDQLGELAAACDPGVYAALERAAANIADFHRRQLQQSWLDTRKDGTIVGQRVRGLARVGIYVPRRHGRLSFVGPDERYPGPHRGGGRDHHGYAAPEKRRFQSRCHGGGLYRGGGCGLSRRRCPGRRGPWLTAPPRFRGWTRSSVPAIFTWRPRNGLVYGQVDIDMVAGPSEILVLADASADPRYLAADLMSQAEHDALASSILLTDSAEIAERTLAELEKQVQALPRQEIIRRSLADYGAVIVCRDMEEAVAFANRLAPEHLEVMCSDPMSYIGRLDNAGSVFLGKYSPEPLGDYYAGPNHVLPTSGTARFFSPVGGQLYQEVELHLL